MEAIIVTAMVCNFVAMVGCWFVSPTRTNMVFASLGWLGAISWCLFVLKNL